MDRRTALRLLGFGLVAPAAVPIDADPSPAEPPFLHGVASGDPTAGTLIIWTRITLPPAAGSRVVSWVVAEDAALRRVVARGRAATGPERDHTVKVDVAGLQPGRDYWYGFRLGPHRSPVGRTRTLTRGPLSEATLAVLSCAHFQCGLFNVYDAVARLEQVDAIVHLGDYIYEDADGASQYAAVLGGELKRAMAPPNELLTLDDYRARYALYRRDPDLQAAHARAAWICQWDDHETANDCWVGGAEKHDPKTEGPWALRKAAALKAYLEWMPIRDPAPGRAREAVNRSFQFGDLASLVMMETRLVARAHQLSYEHDLVYRPGADGRPAPDMDAFQARLNDPARQVLGAPQEDWLRRELEASLDAGRTWQVLGSGVVMAPVIAPDVKGLLGPLLSDVVLAALPEDQRARASRTADIFAYRTPYDLDSWDGYPAARERLYGILRETGARPIVISGDSHAFWANELLDAQGARAGVELGTTSVTSPGICDIVPALPINRFIQDANPHVRFCDHGAKGFVKLTLTHRRALAELVAVSTVRAKPYAVQVLRRFETSPLPDGGVSGLVDA